MMLLYGKTPEQYAQHLLELCNGDIELAKIECFNSARQHDRAFPKLSNMFWVDCYAEILEQSND